VPLQGNNFINFVKPEKHRHLESNAVLAESTTINL